MTNSIRFVMEDGDLVRSHLRGNNGDEQFTFFLAKKFPTTRENSLYIGEDFILPDRQDLSSQSPVFIAPTKQYQGFVYNMAYDKIQSVFDAHIHPFQKGVPSFSGTDMRAALKNAEFISNHMPEEVDFGFIVFNESCTAYSGLIYNKTKRDFDPIDSIEFINSPIEILLNNQIPKIAREESYSRHYLIPGWNQSVLSELKVAIIGAGGLGSLMIQALACMGVGSGNGSLTIIDNDRIEESNLSRIPYAYKKQIGWNKARVAKDFIRRKNPDINVHSIPMSVQDENIGRRLKECHFIIGAVDSNGARKIISQLAHEASIPYLDTGTEIFPKENSYDALGQVRLAIPRRGCLVCTNGIRLDEAARELASENDNEQLAKAGYVRGTSESPTPSVIHLNGVIANIAISQMIKFVFGEDFDHQKTVFYDQRKMRLIPAGFKRNKDCPLCGEKPDEEEIKECMEELERNIQANKNQSEDGKAWK